MIEAPPVARKKSFLRLFKRKPSSIFLDYEGMSFDTYLQQKSLSLRGHTQSLRSSLDSYSYSRPQDRLRGSRDLPDLPKELSKEPSYESLQDEPALARPLFFSFERQLSHNEEEVSELAPEYYCISEEEQRQRKSREEENIGKEDFYRPWSEKQEATSEGLCPVPRPRRSVSIDVGKASRKEGVSQQVSLSYIQLANQPRRGSAKRRVCERNHPCDDIPSGRSGCISGQPLATGVGK